MIFNALSIVLAVAPAAILAAPTATTISNIKLSQQAVQFITNPACDISHLTMPAAPTALPAPAAGLSLAHIAIGRGTQNYTCNTAVPSSAPTLIGANAYLYNATCNAVHYPDLFNMYSTYAMSETPPYKSDVAKLLLSGHHVFTAAGSPYFNLDSDNGQFGYAVFKKNGTSNAPSTADVPWLKLTATEGDFKEVYRLNTVQGQAPTTCLNQKPSFEIPYAAVYWFWK